VDAAVAHHSMLLRHLLSIALLPFLVVVIVPWTLRDGCATPDQRCRADAPGRGLLWGRLGPSLLRALGGAGLERRFGEEYRVYKANIPRWYRSCSRGLVRSTAFLEARVPAQAG
jgi:hypothetical protein